MKNRAKKSPTNLFSDIRVLLDELDPWRDRLKYILYFEDFEKLQTCAMKKGCWKQGQKNQRKKGKSLQIKGHNDDSQIDCVDFNTDEEAIKTFETAPNGKTCQV